MGLRWPRWLRWLDRVVPAVTIYQDLGVEPEDIRELETLAEIEHDEDERAQREADMTRDGGI